MNARNILMVTQSREGRISMDKLPYFPVILSKGKRLKALRRKIAKLARILEGHTII